jgi:hypothetical protein
MLIERSPRQNEIAPDRHNEGGMSRIASSKIVPT